MKDGTIEMLNVVAQTIYDKKGFNILAIDVREISTLTDYLLIAEGTVGRHVQSLCRAIKEKIEESKFDIYHLEGDRTGDWIVVDCGEIMVHLFVPELREKYGLEELWHEGKLVDLKLKIQESPDEKR